MFSSQFELVCERGSLGFVSTSVIFAGFFIGSIVVSSFSDKFGRKRPLFLCGFICCIVHLVSAFSPAFWVFTLFRGIVGFTIGKLCNFVVALLERLFPFLGWAVTILHLKGCKVVVFLSGRDMSPALRWKC